MAPVSGSSTTPLFRKTALNRLSDPEQLDQLLTVARPADWITYCALMTLVLSGLAWSVLGTVATRVAGSGILVSEGGAIYAPVAISDGMVVELMA